MAEPVARLVSATVTFEPKTSSGYGAGIVLAHQQKVTLSRSPEKKELLSNDETINATVIELETKVDYEFSTEIGDTKLDVLAIAFKGLVSSKTYAVGDTYWNGKTIKDSDELGSVGDIVLDGTTLYVVKESYTAGSFSTAHCSDRTYAATQMHLNPEKKENSLGRVTVDGTNMATGSAQVLIIPLVNLSFDGDFALSDSDFAKLSFKGKVLKTTDNPRFTLIDA